MPEKTDAQKRAQKTYMEKFARVEIRMNAERRTVIQAHADAQGQSVNAYINTAIDSRIAQEAPGGPQEAGVVSLSPDTLKAAQEGAEATGEAMPEFISRAVEEQVRRDRVNGEALGEPIDELTTSVQPVPKGTLAAAAIAAKAAGEKTSDFISRAVTTQAQRDALAQKMKGGQ